MVVNADRLGGPSAADDDPRITKTGRWLRRSKLDELPPAAQRSEGEMSFVGPRPEVAQEVALYSDEERALLGIRPGIYGLGLDPTSATKARSCTERRTLTRLYRRVIRPGKDAARPRIRAQPHRSRPTSGSCVATLRAVVGGGLAVTEGSTPKHPSARPHGSTPRRPDDAPGEGQPRRHRRSRWRSLLAVLYGGIPSRRSGDARVAGPRSLRAEQGPRVRRSHARCWPSAASSRSARLAEFYQDGTRMAGHVTHGGVPGVEVSDRRARVSWTVHRVRHGVRRAGETADASEYSRC